jgi:hypothetical protein
MRFPLTSLTVTNHTCHARSMSSSHAALRSDEVERERRSSISPAPIRVPAHHDFRKKKSSEVNTVSSAQSFEKLSIFLIAVRCIHGRGNTRCRNAMTHSQVSALSERPRERQFTHPYSIVCDDGMLKKSGSLFSIK